MWDVKREPRINGQAEGKGPPTVGPLLYLRLLPLVNDADYMVCTYVPVL